MGGTLNTRELLGIAAVLRAARGAKEYGQREGEKTVIDHLFHALQANRYLEDKITGSIVGEDEIADAASAELASIRRLMRAASSKVREILNQLLSSSQAKYLQESIITMRSGRYVVPVKSEYKNEIAGLVHDVSGSGGTFFIEPMGVVKANNELRELQAREEKEIERILAELSADAAAHRDDIERDYDIVVTLDGIFARARLSGRMNAMEPRLAGKGILLKKARHPLLDPKTAVANDLTLGEDFDTLVITVPNTGGKTVTLKTIGLLILMAQCGLHIPVADGSHITVFAGAGRYRGRAVHCPVLSTFSSHMTNIVGILGRPARTRSSCLTSWERAPIGGGGGAGRGHHRKRPGTGRPGGGHHPLRRAEGYAMTTAGVENASCEFNVETLAPTYRLLVGIPGKSNAFAISQRLGLPGISLNRPKPARTPKTTDLRMCSSGWTSSGRPWNGRSWPPPGASGNGGGRPRRRGLTARKWSRRRSKAAQRAKAEARAIIDEARRAADEVFQELMKCEKSRRPDKTGSGKTNSGPACAAA
jgi:DNA mismatch repair protein MutS2